MSILNEKMLHHSQVITNYLAFKHHAQVPRWNVPRWLPRQINLLKLSLRSQIMSSRPMNKKFFYLRDKETLSLVNFGKNFDPH